MPSHRTILSAATLAAVAPAATGAAAPRAAPAAASAEGVCAGGAAGCTGTPVTVGGAKAALLAAQTNGTADRFFLPEGVLGASSFLYKSDEKVEIIGAGVG